MPIVASLSYLVCAGGHDPVAIFTGAHTLAGFLKVEILQQLHAIRKLGVILQTPRKMLDGMLASCFCICAPFSLPDKPFWKWSRLAAADGVDRHCRV
jgi:hypothetical protein